MQDLLEQFPTRDTSVSEQTYRSFIYQSERVSLNSRQQLPVVNNPNSWQDDFYSEFTAELKTPLLRIKSLELLRATIPNAVSSFPITQGIFFYYRIPTLGAPNYEPDYSQLTAANIRMVRLLNPFVYSPDNYGNPDLLGWNKTFEDYQSVVDELNKAAAFDVNQATLSPNYFIANDVSFSYDQNLNKIIFRGNNYEAGGVPQYYYLPVGYADPNLFTFISNVRNPAGGGLTEATFPTNGQYTLNRRLGFLWNGIFPPNPPQGSFGYATLFARTVPKPNYNPAAPPWIPLINYTAESYADLVFSANMYLFCDAAGGSTQDTSSEERLLAVLPLDTANLGVAFPESKMECPLTKVSENLFQLRFVLKTDTGEPFWLPRNAYINLELKLTYN